MDGLKKEAIEKIKSMLGIEDDERITELFNIDYLSIMEGRDNKKYITYVDENVNFAFNAETLEELTEEEAEKIIY